MYLRVIVFFLFVLIVGATDSNTGGGMLLGVFLWNYLLAMKPSCLNPS